MKAILSAKHMHSTDFNQLSLICESKEERAIIKHWAKAIETRNFEVKWHHPGSLRDPALEAINNPLITLCFDEKDEKSTNEN